jgi:hypothetical protein
MACEAAEEEGLRAPLERQSGAALPRLLGMELGTRYRLRRRLRLARAGAGCDRAGNVERRDDADRAPNCGP